jgi:hypothetical protein
MIATRTRQSWFAAMSCCALLTACGDPAAQDGAKPGPATTRKPQKQRDAVEEMVAAVSAGKSADALGVYFTLGNPPRVNTALPVQIAVLPHRPFSSLRAFFSTQDGLTMISGDQLPVLTGTSPEKSVEHRVVVMPVKAGVYMITATFETEGEDGAISRTFFIPVIVAPAEQAASPAAAPPATGADMPGTARPPTSQSPASQSQASHE